MTALNCIDDSIVIVGCGGFGRETFAMLKAIEVGGHPVSIEGFVDDAPSDDDIERVRRLGSRVLGGIETLKSRVRPFSCVIAVGSPIARSELADQLRGLSVHFPSVIHPCATVALDVQPGVGAIIAPGARIGTNVQLGEHCHVDQNATIGHDAVVGPFVRVNPAACISGSVSLEKGVLVGANSTVLQGLRVGEGAIVGAGAVLTHDGPPNTILTGVPARARPLIREHA